MGTGQGELRLMKAEFAARCRRNPRYSLRAYAKALGVSHTYLSLLFSGKRRLTQEASVKIAEKLGISGSQSTEPLDLDRFAVIADWYHYAILSLLEIPEFKMTSAWISERLGISDDEAKLAIDRLKKLELVVRKEGRWIQGTKPIRMDNTQSTAATRGFYRQLLERASDSLDRDAFENRCFRSMTLAMNPDDVPYATQQVRQFLRGLSLELESRSTPTTVYQIANLIFPVSKPVSIHGETQS